MITHILLALVFLFGLSTAAIADNFHDGYTAYIRSDYATALEKFKQVASTDCSKCPSLKEFLIEVRPLNPGYSDDALSKAWSEEFGPIYENRRVVAQFILGLMYDQGQGVPQDYAEAIRWFTKAADQGHASAQYILGFMYKNGQGVPQDFVQAIRWYRKAAEQGDKEAQYFLARMYEEGQGVPQDYAEAIRWYRKAAEQGHAGAQFNLGVMYDEGHGVPQDYAEAIRWYRKAADQGDASAQYILGLMYDQGQGGPQDYAEAIRWFTKAADQGHASAQYILGFMYNNGRGVPQDFKQAIHWYRKAADQGHADAQNNLGFMYGTGKGIPQDYVQAHKWYNLSAASGVALASKNRDLLERKMTPSQLAEAQRLAREWKPTTGTAPDRLHETRESKPTASGTGFVVSRQGHILTNNHVIEGCRMLRATTEGRTKELTVVGSDAKNDLAVLKLPAPPSNVARFREGRNIRSGDGVVVVGFPLSGLLASEANVTTGTVSALAGLGNDARFLQITAPVQPGNSGGPLLDQSGHIVGVVVSKLDAMKIAKVTGDIPQNINFAINGTVARTFLDANSVEYEISTSSKSMSAAEIGATAKKFTLLLDCYR